MADDMIDVTEGLDLKLPTSALAAELLKNGKALSLKHASLLVQAAKAKAKIAKAKQIAEQAKKKADKAESERKKIELRQKDAQGKKSRKDDSRYKILVGAAILAARKESAEVSTWIVKMLDKYTTREKDRIFLGLQPQILEQGQAAPPAETKSDLEKNGPVRFPVCVYPFKDGFSSYLHDFPNQGASGKTQDEVLERARETIQNAMSANTLPKPSTEEIALAGFQSMAEVKRLSVSCELYWTVAE